MLAALARRGGRRVTRALLVLALGCTAEVPTAAGALYAAVDPACGWRVEALDVGFDAGAGCARIAFPAGDRRLAIEPVDPCQAEQLPACLVTAEPGAVLV